MVEEDAADSAPFFTPVRVYEIMIAPHLEAGIELGVMPFAY
jgi:hypothetical protein